MKDLPKAINCRLKASEDMDIMYDLQRADDKTARIKELYRMGMQYEKERSTSSEDVILPTRDVIIVRIPKELPKPFITLPHP